MSGDRTPLVDVHAHFVTAAYAEAGRAAGIETPDGMGPWPDWSLEQQLDDMGRRAIGRAVLSVSSPGVHFGDDLAAGDLARSLNDVAADARRAHPERIAFFASLPLPDVDGAVAEIDRALESLGAVGVALLSNAGGMYLGDPSLDPVWAELDARCSIAFVHPTSPPGWEGTALGRPRPMIEFEFDLSRSIVDLVLAGVPARYPHIRFVVPHSGAVLPDLSARISLFQRDFGFGPDLSWDDAFGRLWFDIAGTPFPSPLPFLAASVGTERIVYGSDSCWTASAGVDEQVASIDAASDPIPGTSWRELTSANASRLLPGC